MGPAAGKEEDEETLGVTGHLEVAAVKVCFSGSFSAGLLGVPQPWQTARGGFLLLLAVCWGGEVTSIPARNWELNLQCDFSGSRFQLLVLKHFSLVN